MGSSSLRDTPLATGDYELPQHREVLAYDKRISHLDSKQKETVVKRTTQ